MPRMNKLYPSDAFVEEQLSPPTPTKLSPRTTPGRPGSGGPPPYRFSLCGQAGARRRSRAGRERDARRRRAGRCRQPAVRLPAGDAGPAKTTRMDAEATAAFPRTPVGRDCPRIAWPLPGLRALKSAGGPEDAAARNSFRVAENGVAAAANARNRRVRRRYLRSLRRICGGGQG